MLKNIVKLEHVLAGKVYHFLCDNDSPIEHVKDALFQFVKFAGQIEDQVKAQMEQQKSESDPVKVEAMTEVKADEPVATA